MIEYIIIAIVVLVGIWITVSYNRLVGLQNSVKQAWAGVDVQLKRRADLIPNLTQVVGGYATHEKKLLVQISSLRAGIMAQPVQSQIAQLDSQLSSCVKQLFAVAENYPKLQADKQFLKLQQELSNTENQIAASRRIYNENTTLYNTAIESFPANIIAASFSFSKQELYQI